MKNIQVNEEKNLSSDAGQVSASRSGKASDTLQPIHLTLTGYYAGRPLCDVDKPEAKERGERFIHAMYFDFNGPLAVDLCDKCKTEYDAAMAEDDEEVS